MLGESGLDAGEHGADDARLEASTGGFAYGILRVVRMAVIIVRGHGLERLRRQLSEEDGGSSSWFASFRRQPKFKLFGSTSEVGLIGLMGERWPFLAAKHGLDGQEHPFLAET